jgi:hypothetical protein
MPACVEPPGDRGCTVTNPWLELPAAPPFAPEDDDVLARLAPRLRGEYEQQLDLRPQPWSGSVHTASVFMLALNPGFHPND